MSFCRICGPLCGTIVDVEDNVVVRINGDSEHPLTKGFTCPKGRRYGQLHSDPGRITTAQRRRPDGTFEAMDTAAATLEIAARLDAILAAHGPEAIGIFIGTASYSATLTYTFGGAWHRAIGSHKRYTTNTIDQTAKVIAMGRLGYWDAGFQRFPDSDVYMLVGTNPPLSLQGATGFPIHDGLRTLDEARARGMKVIVVDPRRTEVAAHADLHVALKPGTDATLFAGLIHVVLDEGLHDAEFCDRWVDGLDDLRAAVAWATPEVVGRHCDIDPEVVVRAARMFGGARARSRALGHRSRHGPPCQRRRAPHPSPQRDLRAVRPRRRHPQQHRSARWARESGGDRGVTVAVLGDQLPHAHRGDGPGR